ncbi:unnamed protein product, partial [Prorocentrum cordatum]
MGTQNLRVHEEAGIAAGWRPKEADHGTQGSVGVVPLGCVLEASNSPRVKASRKLPRDGGKFATSADQVGNAARQRPTGDGPWQRVDAIARKPLAMPPGPLFRDGGRSMLSAAGPSRDSPWRGLAPAASPPPRGAGAPRCPGRCLQVEVRHASPGGSPHGAPSSPSGGAEPPRAAAPGSGPPSAWKRTSVAPELPEGGSPRRALPSVAASAAAWPSRGGPRPRPRVLTAVDQTTPQPPRSPSPARRGSPSSMHVDPWCHYGPQPQDTRLRSKGRGGSKPGRKAEPPAPPGDERLRVEWLGRARRASQRRGQLAARGGRQLLAGGGSPWLPCGSLGRASAKLELLAEGARGPLAEGEEAASGLRAAARGKPAMPPASPPGRRGPSGEALALPPRRARHGASPHRSREAAPVPSPVGAALGGAASGQGLLRPPAVSLPSARAASPRCSRFKAAAAGAVPVLVETVIGYLHSQADGGEPRPALPSPRRPATAPEPARPPARAPPEGGGPSAPERTAVLAAAAARHGEGRGPAPTHAECGGAPSPEAQRGDPLGRGDASAWPLGSSEPMSPSLAAVGRTEACIRTRRSVYRVARIPARVSFGACSSLRTGSPVQGFGQDAQQGAPRQGSPSRGEEAAGEQPSAVDEGAEEPAVERQAGDATGRLRETAWADIFRKLQVDGEVHCDDLETAVYLCGHVLPDRQWILEILGQLTRYSRVGFEEFLEFGQRYMERQRRAYLEAFQEQGRGSRVTSVDVVGVLDSLGLAPLEHVVAELLPEVGVEPGGTLEESQFLELAELLSLREGFTLSEFQEFMDIFTRFDWDCSGQLDLREFGAVLTFLGYSWGPHRAAELVTEVDVDQSGSLNEREFLMCMRLIREHEIRAMQRAASEHPHRPDLVLSSLDLLCPEPDLLLECLADAGAREPQGALGPSALWRMVRAYRLRSGWSASSTQEFRALFDRQDHEGSGEVCPSRLGLLLRQTGRVHPFDQQRRCFERVAPSFDGLSFPLLSFDMFLKVVHLLRQGDLAEYKRRFMELLGQERASCTTREIALELLAELGLDVDGYDPGDLSAQVDLCGFLGTADHLAARERDARVLLRGFSAEQFGSITRFFRARATDGTVSARDLAAILEQVYPDLATGENFRAYIQRAMVEDPDEDPLEFGRIAYERFVQIVEMFGAFQDEERMKKEEAARR